MIGFIALAGFLPPPALPGWLFRLALLVPLTPLAEGTSLATLAVFALVNLALLRLKYRGAPSNIPQVTVRCGYPQPDL